MAQRVFAFKISDKELKNLNEFAERTERSKSGVCRLALRKLMGETKKTM